MVKAVEEMWPSGEERARLHRMHDIFHQGHNMLMHHSARSLSIGVEIDQEGNASFRLGPSTDLVGLALGFAFWTYANTISVTLDGDELARLSALATRFDRVVPDRALRRLVDADGADEPT
jgi:hypothetical protein